MTLPESRLASCEFENGFRAKLRPPGRFLVSFRQTEERARATLPVCPWSSAEEKSRLRFSLEHFVNIACILYICFYCLCELFSFVFSYQLKHSNYSKSVLEISAFWSRCSTQDADVNTYTFVPFLPRCRTNTAAGVVTVCCCHHDGVLLS